MAAPKPTERVLPDQPAYQPLERFWPYADLAEQPSDEELAELHPELREALFGAAQSAVFDLARCFRNSTGDAYERAVALAEGVRRVLDVGVRADGRWHRARFFTGDRPMRLRDLY